MEFSIITPWKQDNKKNPEVVLEKRGSYRFCKIHMKHLHCFFLLELQVSGVFMYLIIPIL